MGVKKACDQDIEAFGFVYDIHEAIRDWNTSTAILLGEIEGDASTACFLISQLAWKLHSRSGYYHESLRRLAAGGLSHASPTYQSAQKAVLAADSLLREVSTILGDNCMAAQGAH